MTDSTPRTLLEDLEAIRKSLDKIAKSEPQIPTLEEVVGHRAPTTVNPDNPFLSSQSLSELIRIRNEAEARAAEELAKVEPIRPITDILESEPEQLPLMPPAPDPDEIISQMESLFDTWVEHSVSEYLTVFENELRNRLQQDFRDLVIGWYREHELPVPDSFQAQESSASETPDADSETD